MADRLKMKLNPINVLETIGTYRFEDYKIKSNNMFEFEDREEIFYKKLEWNIIEEDDDIINTTNNINSALISGIAGCGKTELIKNIYNETDLILSFNTSSDKLGNWVLLFFFRNKKFSNLDLFLLCI